MAQRRQTSRQAGARTTRAQRRAAERHQQKLATSRRGIPGVQIIGGLITIAVVAVIVVSAFVRLSNFGKATGAAVTTPGAYSPSTNMLKVGTRAPDFRLTDSRGRSYSLSAQRGHPVVLEFFAVWCPHCQREAPIIQSLDTQYKSEGVRVWSVLASPYGRNYDNSFGFDTTPASAADLRWFAKTFHEHVPQLVDPSFHVVNQYGISSYPGIYVIDKNGKIVHSSAGEQPRSVLASAIDSAIHGS